MNKRKSLFPDLVCGDLTLSFPFILLTYFKIKIQNKIYNKKRIGYLYNNNSFHYLFFIVIQYFRGFHFIYHLVQF
jgi:hypothetical protein